MHSFHDWGWCKLRFGRKPRTTDCTGPDDVHSPKHENPDKGYDLFRMHSLVLEQEYEYLWQIILRSLSILDATTDTDDMIIPIKRPLLEVLGSVRTYQETGLLCRHMHLLKQQELFVVLRGFYTKKELTAFLLHQLRPDNGLRGLFWRTIGKWTLSRSLLVYIMFQNELSAGSFILVSEKVPINGYKKEGGTNKGNNQRFRILLKNNSQTIRVQFARLFHDILQKSIGSVSQPVEEEK